ncbi:hypothetical protein EDI_336040 [Entamoeba dispar SAW760]|uniref:RING-type domain-containing protein n=1 Tax=Entamoeba dispar (strain ATCC PRA-260 / SAW760) TaxID=370354 RepID=B0ERS1_ENTDS|nr:uncharacterized protein EDI_336040 [Entamoeba dispar SAW760]EDR22716.1 hypothetical protein EDI_336040 [Entamoeba dispar SAW760]|eukprot:EDR22716.1 hypothetical protein EDI_336040 [Entamoeba dispar SAW760]
MNNKCCICYSDIVDCTITPCGHAFCYQCIKEWLVRVPNCPICKSRVLLEQVIRVNKNKNQPTKTEKPTTSQDNLPLIKFYGKLLFALLFPLVMFLVITQLMELK